MTASSSSRQRAAQGLGLRSSVQDSGTEGGTTCGIQSACVDAPESFSGVVPMPDGISGSLIASCSFLMVCITRAAVHSGQRGVSNSKLLWYLVNKASTEKRAGFRQRCEGRSGKTRLACTRLAMEIRCNATNRQHDDGNDASAPLPSPRAGPAVRHPRQSAARASRNVLTSVVLSRADDPT